MQSTELPRDLRRRDWIIGAVLCAGFCALLIAAGLDKYIDHDEHHYVGPAALYARHGMLPYRDYAYLHMPYLVFVYGWLFRLTRAAHLLTTARAVSIACSCATLCIVYHVACRLHAGRSLAVRHLVAAGASALLAFTPLFTLTSGRTWNHDAPALLTVCAFLLACRGMRGGGRAGSLAAAGVLLGIAIGVRISLVTAAAGFVIAIFLATGLPLRRRWTLAAVFSLGAALALLPAGIMFLRWPRQFLFDVVQYAAINTRFRRAQGLATAMSFPGKLKFFVTTVLCEPGNAILLALLLGCLWSLRREKAGARHPYHFELLVLLVLIALAFVGCIIPTPVWRQYFFAPVPLIVLLVVYASADVRLTAAWRSAWLGVVGALVLTSVAFGANEYRYIRRLLKPKQWTANNSHRLGRELRDRLGSGGGRVLTFSPVYALEGGFDVYPEFAAGVFGFRAAHLIPAEQRGLYVMASPEELPELLRCCPPRAVLIGSEPQYDPALLQAAGAEEWPHVRYDAVRPEYPLYPVLYVSPAGR